MKRKYKNSLLMLLLAAILLTPTSQSFARQDVSNQKMETLRGPVVPYIPATERRSCNQAPGKTFVRRTYNNRVYSGWLDLYGFEITGVCKAVYKGILYLES